MIAPTYPWPAGGASDVGLDALATCIRNAYAVATFDELLEPASTSEEHVARFSAFLHGVNRSPTVSGATP